MPATNEIVPNRPLTGLEAKQIILDDVQAMLDKDGLFTADKAFPHLAYTVKLIVNLEYLPPPHNVYPNGTSSARAKAMSPNIPPQVVAGPLEGDNIVSIGIQRDRTIENPNAERIKREMPLTVTQRDPNFGRWHERHLHLDPSLLDAEDKDTEKGAKDTDLEPKKEDWEL